MELAGIFALVAVVLTVSALAAGVVERAPISFPMIFLGLGFLLGPRGLEVMDIDVHSPALETVATLTLALVLFLDAVNLEFARERKEWMVPALSLGPGTLVIVAIVAGAGIWLLDMPPVMAFLLGAVLSSTDPVVLRDIVRDRRLPASVRQALKVEAGTNDVVVLPLVIVLAAVARGEVGGTGDWVLFALQLLVLGPAVGFAVGAIGSSLMSRADARFGIRREYQALYGVGLVLGAYASGVAVGGDGFLAAFAAGFAVTILDRELCDCFLEFGEATAEIAMLLAFVMFGVAVSASLTLLPVWQTVTLAVLTIVIARPLALGLLLSLRGVALSAPARAFIAWFGPRGLNSLLFALLVVVSGVPGSELLFAATGAVVLASVLAHGITATPVTGWYARRVAAETLAEEREDNASGLFISHVDDVERISVDELRASLDGDSPPLVLDVRSRSQYQRDAGAIPGSIRVMLDDIAEWAAVQREKKLAVLYCT
ncbi:MAG TPA: cation:proton antiporter [Actinomycetota bacterium]|nr:cation:proton antiporter [Actinomycetota bacterium]